jgi:hypothetical protein
LNGNVSWLLSIIPPRKFYFELHSHLKKNKSLRKCDIGNIYVAIDPQLKVYRADNAYRKIDIMLKVHRQNLDTPMTYYKEKSKSSASHVTTQPINTLSELQNKSDKAACKVNSHYVKRNVDRREKRKDARLLQVQEKLCIAEKGNESLQLNVAETKSLFNQATLNLEATKPQLESEKKVSSNYQFDSEELHETIVRLTEENQSLKENIAQLQEELNSTDSTIYSNLSNNKQPDSEDFFIKTICGKCCSNGVRELYYKLLTMQVTPGKIADIIRCVLQSITPSVNIESVKLPIQSAALYQEIPTVNDIQKATILSDTMHMHLTLMAPHSIKKSCIVLQLMIL